MNRTVKFRSTRAKLINATGTRQTKRRPRIPVVSFPREHARRFVARTVHATCTRRIVYIQLSTARRMKIASNPGAPERNHTAVTREKLGGRRRNTIQATIRHYPPRDPTWPSAFNTGNVYDPKFRRRPRRNFDAQGCTTSIHVRIHIHAVRGGWRVCK